jgi:hypothetical protein
MAAMVGSHRIHAGETRLSRRAACVGLFSSGFSRVVSHVLLLVWTVLA